MRRIYLIGYMGSGKSTIARTLGEQLEWRVVDIDELVADHCNLTIPKVFEKYGEHIFRGIETDVIRSTMHYDRTIIATGGGAPCHSGNMEWFREHGLVVYLKLGPDAIYERLINEREVRPLVAQKDPKQLLSFIIDHLGTREAYYEKADFVIDADVSVPEIVNQIISAVQSQHTLAVLKAS